MIHGKGTQPYAALTQNASCLHELMVMILWPEVMAMYMFLAITFFPDEEFFFNSFNSKKMLFKVILDN